MFLKLFLDGLELQLKIDNYNSNDNEWAKTSLFLKFQNIINYELDNKEMLLCSEIDELRDCLYKLINNEYSEIEELEFEEPDLEFNLYPSNEILDISMDLQINLWDNGLTCNNISTTFSKTDIEALYYYLLLVTNKIDKDSENIQKLIKDGVIY